MSPIAITRLLILAAVWGASFLFMRITAPVLGAVPTAFGRVLLGALGLLALVALLRIPLSFHGKFRAALALGVINSGIPFLMYALAARVLPASRRLLTAFISRIAFGLGEATTRRQPRPASSLRTQPLSALCFWASASV